MKYAWPGCGAAGHEVLRGQDESVHQVVHVGVVELGVLTADQHLDVPGDDALEELCGTSSGSPRPQMPLGRMEQVSRPSTPFWSEDELLGHHLGFGVEVVEAFGVRQRLVAAGDALPAHHHTVGGGVDESLDSGLLPGVHQVLGALDVHRVAALSVFVGHRRAAHQLDDRRGVKDRVDPVHRRGTDGRVGDVALQHLQLRMLRQGRRSAVERSHLVSAVEQGGHQVRADEARAPGDQDASEFGLQRCITHSDEG